MTALSLGDVLEMIDEATKDKPRAITESDLTVSKYRQHFNMYSDRARCELDLLVEHNYATKIRCYPARGGSVCNVYVLKGHENHHIDVVMKAASDLVDKIYASDPRWLHDNDVTVERYAGHKRCSRDVAKGILNQLVADGYFDKVKVGVRGMPCATIAYRPTGRGAIKK